MFEVLAGHKAFVSELREGKMKVKTPDDQSHQFEVLHGGIAEVSQNQATILL
jgi:F0F1-type ATP synthase epsilon subunit